MPQEAIAENSIRIAPGLKINELTIKSWWDIDGNLAVSHSRILQSLAVSYQVFRKFTGGLGMNKLTGMKHSRALTC